MGKKDKFLKALSTREEIVVPKIISNEYKSVVDYKQINILDENIVKDLIKEEKQIVFHKKKMSEHLLEISSSLYNAQQILSSYNSSEFFDWYTSLGLSKSFVYRAIDKYNFFLKYNAEEFLELPYRVITEIKQNKYDFEDVEILEIAKSDNPSVLLNTFKKQKIEEINNKVNEKFRSETSKEEVKNKLKMLNDDLDVTISKFIKVKEEYIFLKEQITKIKKTKTELKNILKQI